MTPKPSCVMLLACLPFSFDASAQDTPTDGQSTAAAQSTRTEGTWGNASLTLSGEHTFTADFDNSVGNASVSRVGLDLSMRFRVAERTFLTPGVFAERSFYDFATPNALAGTLKPWDDTGQLGATMGVTHQLDDRLGIFARAGVTSARESGGDFGESVTYSIAAGFRYGIAENLSGGIALGYSSRLADDDTFIPLPIIDWKINDQWSLSTYGDGNGGGAELAYTASETLSFFLRGGYESRQFRLDSEGAAPGGVGRDSRIPVTLGVVWKAMPQFSFTARAGYAFGQQYTLYDSSEVKIAEENVQGAMMLGISAGLQF